MLCALVYTVLFDPVTQFICWEGKNVSFVSFTPVNLERLSGSPDFRSSAKDARQVANFLGIG